MYSTAVQVPPSGWATSTKPWLAETVTPWGRVLVTNAPSGPISVSRTTEPPGTPSGSPVQSIDTPSRAAPLPTWKVTFLYAHGRPLVG